MRINKQIFISIFLLAIFCSIISQLPDLRESILGSVLKASWFLPVTFCAFTPPFLSKKLARPFFIFFASFSLYCVIMEFFTGLPYLNTDLINISMSIIIFITSFCIWSFYGTDKLIKQVAVVSLLATIIVALITYNDFIADSEVTEKAYAYSSKNSLAPIILNTIIICFFGYTSKLKTNMVVWYAALIFLVFILFRLKSRTALIGFFFVIGYIILKSKNQSLKKGTIFFLILSILYLLVDQESLIILRDNILYAGRNADDLDDLSSGRLESFIEAVNIIETYPVFGHGEFYIDCFPIAILCQYGLIGLFIVSVFLIWLAFFVTRKIGTNSKVDLINFLLFWCIIINALFEAQAPFGPGTKCFAVWMFVGFSFSHYHKSHLSFIKTRRNLVNKHKICPN